MAGIFEYLFGVGVLSTLSPVVSFNRGRWCQVLIYSPPACFVSPNHLLGNVIFASS